MAAKVVYPLRIFYDGSCSLCAAKMEAYRQKDANGHLVFVDISAPSFDPAPYGIPLEAFMYEMHAIDTGGAVYRGVDAFRVIWRALPSNWYGLLGTMAGLPGVNLLARLAYRVVARTRRFLPGGHEQCSDGTCGIGRGKG